MCTEENLEGVGVSGCECEGVVYIKICYDAFRLDFKGSSGEAVGVSG